MSSVVDDPRPTDAEGRTVASSVGLHLRPWTIAAGLGAAFVAGFASLGAAIGPELLHVDLMWKGAVIAGAMVAAAGAVIYQALQDLTARAVLREAEDTIKGIHERRRPFATADERLREHGAELTQEERDAIALQTLDTGRLEAIVLEEFEQSIDEPGLRREMRLKLVRLGRVQAVTVERMSAGNPGVVSERADEDGR